MGISFIRLLPSSRRPFSRKPTTAQTTTAQSRSANDSGGCAAPPPAVAPTMRTYAVMHRLGRQHITPADGFNWGAFFFTYPWVLAHRTWSLFWAWTGVNALLVGLLVSAGEDVVMRGIAFWSSVAGSVIVGRVANESRIRALEMRGWEVVRTVSAHSVAHAEVVVSKADAGSGQPVSA